VVHWGTGSLAASSRQERSIFAIHTNFRKKKNAFQLFEKKILRPTVDKKNLFIFFAFTKEVVKNLLYGKMEEDVKPEDEFGVGGQGMTFGLVRGAGAFAAVLPSFTLVSRMPFAQHNHGFGHFFSATSSSRREAMVVGALARDSAFRVGLGVSGATIVSASCACPSHLWISRVLTSSSSLGISTLFCRATQCM
jgi:hypothetical protein